MIVTIVAERVIEKKMYNMCCRWTFYMHTNQSIHDVFWSVCCLLLPPVSLMRVCPHPVAAHIPTSNISRFIYSLLQWLCFCCVLIHLHRVWENSAVRPALPALITGNKWCWIRAQMLIATIHLWQTEKAAMFGKKSVDRFECLTKWIDHQRTIFHSKKRETTPSNINLNAADSILRKPQTTALGPKESVN